MYSQPTSQQTSSTTLPTLHALGIQIMEEEGLKYVRRKNLRSALNTFAKWSDRDLTSIPACPPNHSRNLLDHSPGQTNRQTQSL